MGKRTKNAPVRQLQDVVSISNVDATLEVVNEMVEAEVEGEANGYWGEIAALCIEGESLRVQKKLLKKARSNKRGCMKDSSINSDNSVLLKSASDEVTKLCYLVDMLESYERAS